MPIDNHEELFYWVDEKDKVLGSVTRKDAHGGSMRIHRGVGILVLNENQQILLQQRSLQKDLNPGAWMISAGGHVQYGQTYKEAAERELKEELGIDPELRLVIEKFPVESLEQREIGSVYECTVASDTTFSIDKDEVEKVEWVDLKGLPTFIKTHEFSDFSVQILKKRGYI
jgi:isopentenyl-diphosphate delta-isomerase type 1